MRKESTTPTLPTTQVGKKPAKPLFSSVCGCCARLFSFLLLSLFPGACQVQVFPPDKAPEYMAVVDHTPFFLLGPSQESGPDLSLRTDARFKLLAREPGYSRVQLEDSRQGYVPNENIAPAPPRPRETAQVQGPVGSPSRRSKGRPYLGPAVNDTPLPDRDVPMPDLNINPEILPDAKPPGSAEPTPAPAPKFRI